MYNSRTEDSKDNYETPQYFFDILNNEFHFTLDVCADEYNHKLFRYYTIEDDGLKQDWSGEVCWCNPPFKHVKHWAKKCYEESKKPNTTVVMILPSRTETEYWHKYIMKSYEIRFCKGRVNFVLNGVVKKGVNFPLAIAIFREHNDFYPRLRPFYHKLKDFLGVVYKNE